MSTLAAVAWLALALAMTGIAPAAFILAREAYRRVATSRALRRLEIAQAALRGADPEKLEELGRLLVSRFDQATIERAVEATMRDSSAERSAFGRRLAAELKLGERLAKRAREARKWGERAHAAEMLGLMESAAGAPALVAVLRDPHEDAESVKAAAAVALGRIHHPEAIPLLIAELHLIDEYSSPKVASALVRFGSVAVPAVLELLHDPEHSAARVWAARILGRIGDRTASGPLAARLQDREDLLRVAAAEALGMLGDPTVLQPLIRAALRDPAPQVRAHAAAALARIQGDGAVDVLVASLSDPDYGTRIRALEALESIELKDTSALESALHDMNAEVRRRAALALERVGFLDRVVNGLASDDSAVVKKAYRDIMRLGSAGLVESIAAYLVDERLEVRARIATACGELGLTAVAPLLLSSLSDEAWPVRAALCEAIGRLAPAAGPAALAPCLVDREESVRGAAAEALSKYPADAVAPFWSELLAAYDKGDIPVRFQAVTIAGRIHRPETTDLLVRAARDPSERVRRRAVESLAGRDERVSAEALVERLTDASIEIRMAAVTALGTNASAAAFEGLLRALPGALPEARDRIADALSKGGQAHVRERLEELAGSEILDVRLGVAWTVGKVGDPVAVPVLARFLRDPHPALRASAAGALGKIPGAASVEALLSTVDDRDPKTRAAVVNALAKVGEAGAPLREALARRLGDPDRFVRNRAAITLARVRDPEGEGMMSDVRGALDDAAYTVALGVLGSPEGIDVALTAIADPTRLASVRAFIDKEELATRARFFGNLRLEDPSGAPGRTLDAKEIAAQYELALRASQDPASRRIAIEGLARLQTERSLEIVADALAGDPVEAVRLRAGQVLAPLVADAMPRAALVRAVGDPSPEVAIVAIRALRETRDGGAAAALFRRLGASSAAVNDAIEEALSRIHEHDLVSFFDRMMGEDRPDAMAASVRVLERIGTPAALPLLLQLVRSRAAVVRVASVRALARLPLPEASSAVDGALEDPDEGVRDATVQAIAGAGSSTPVLRLAGARSDPSIRVRVTLARCLERIAGAPPLKVLESLVEDASSPVRATALASMLARADSESLEAFARLWSKAALDTRHDLRDEPRAAAVTERLSSALTQSVSPRAREIAVAGLGALASPGFAPLLFPALRDPAPSVRVAAIRALAGVDDADARERVAALKEDSNAEVREAARRAHVRSVG